jgi:hypothetical protein
MRAGWGVVAGLLAASVTGCVSSSRHVVGSFSPTTPPVTAGHLPTVPNCGGGAYEPHTLLIVCGVGTTMATGVNWASWTATSAQGNGTVHLDSSGRSVSVPAGLLLDHVVSGTDGPQYSVLTVTWTGPSPDGHPTDTYHLAVGVP